MYTRESPADHSPEERVMTGLIEHRLGTPA